MTPGNLGRRQAPVSDRLAARALALAVEPGTSIHTAADSLVDLARGDADLLQRALSRLASRPAGRPSHLASSAAHFLRAAIELVADSGPAETTTTGNGGASDDPVNVGEDHRTAGSNGVVLTVVSQYEAEREPA